MLKIKTNKLKFRGQQLIELVLFLNAVQHCNGKDIIVELYPYLSEESRKDDSSRNHLRHELFYTVDDANWQLLEDLKIETEGYIVFFAQQNFWQIINQAVKQYLVDLGICSESEIIEM